MNKKERAPLTEKERLARAARKRKLRHGAYATGITVAFVVAVVLFNIAATVLADRFPFRLDLTGKGDYSISEDNAKVIEKIARDDLAVTIVVCGKEAEYSEGALQHNYYDPSDGKYFRQAAALLKEYEQRNPAITVRYVEQTDPDFNEYSSQCPGETFSTGDLLLLASFTDGGEKVSRWRHLTMEEIFEINYDSNDQTSYTYAMYYGMMTLMSSKLETQVTSALVSLTSEKVYNVAVLTHNNGTAPAELQALMKQNNYQFTEISNLNEQQIPEDADAIIIACPVHDYTEAELAQVDAFLENGDKLGKALLYIADASQPDLPNLNEFLSEWGFSVMAGTYVWETDSANTALVGNSPLFKLTEEENDYTGKLSDKDSVFYSTNDVAIRLKNANGTREAEALLSFAGTAKALPTDAQSIEEAVADGPFVGLGVCRLTPSTFDDPTTVKRSYVIVCSSSSFFPIGDYSAMVGNLYAVMNTFDVALEKTDVGVHFDSRTFTTDRLEALPTAAQVYVWTGVLAGVILLALVLTAVVITTRRRAGRKKQ